MSYQHQHLIRMAARLIGVEGEFVDGGIKTPDGSTWNPIKNGDDLLTMEASAGLSVFWYKDCVAVGVLKASAQGIVMFKRGKSGVQQYANHDSDKNRARAVAATEAAANIYAAIEAEKMSQSEFGDDSFAV